jgi:hypothetical protein
MIPIKHCRTGLVIEVQGSTSNLNPWLLKNSTVWISGRDVVVRDHSWMFSAVRRLYFHGNNDIVPDVTHAWTVGVFLYNRVWLWQRNFGGRLITASPENNPWGRTDTSSAKQEIPGILWNPKIHCCVRNIRPLVLNLSHINPVFAPPMSYIFTFILILYSSLLVGLTTSGLATRAKPCIRLPPYCHIPCHCHPPSFHISKNICPGPKI